MLRQIFPYRRLRPCFGTVSNQRDNKDRHVMRQLIIPNTENYIFLIVMIVMITIVINTMNFFLLLLLLLLLLSSLILFLLLIFTLLIFSYCYRFWIDFPP